MQGLSCQLEYIMIFQLIHMYRFRGLFTLFISISDFIFAILFQYIRPAYLDKKLNCILLHHKNPFLKIGPFKYEFLSKEPSIGLVHDLMSNKVVEGIKKAGTPLEFSIDGLKIFLLL